MYHSRWSIPAVLDLFESVPPLCSSEVAILLLIFSIQFFSSDEKPINPVYSFMQMKGALEVLPGNQLY